MTRATRLVRQFFSPVALLTAVPVGAAFAALVRGAAEGPFWLLLTGLTVSALALFFLGGVAESGQGGRALALRPGGPRAYAPALVNSVRAVHKETGQSVIDPRDPKSVFAFDLTVVPEEPGLPAYRVEVCHPLDLQDLLHREWAVVEYDPRQPWRVVVPNDPPREWLARAQRLDPETVRATGGPLRGLPAGSQILVLGAVAAGVFLWLLGTLAG
ncbi:hypothetical protein AB0I49_21855 [Streptomyces sp. NPDC050617]|uniref:hypothetical protein n=1 Tax=Streptomyces sp. NPDC050617 TaxID=3154628 RepID=UPI00342020BB